MYFHYHLVLLKIEAVEKGSRIAETGGNEGFPISAAPDNIMKEFGRRLKEYGEKGC